MIALQRAALRLASASAIALLAACGGGGTTPAPPAPCSVEINGDSIMSGTGIATPPPAALAALRPGWVIVDKSVAGLTLADLYAGYTTAYQGGPVPRIGAQPPFGQVQRTARVIVIEPGGNDAFEATAPAVFAAQLRAIVAAVQREGRVAVLTGIVPLVPGPVFDAATVARAATLNAITRQVAADLGALHAGWGEVEFRGQADTLDGVHRTQEASGRLTQVLAGVLDGACGK